MHVTPSLQKCLMTERYFPPLCTFAFTPLNDTVISLIENAHYKNITDPMTSVKNSRWHHPPFCDVISGGQEDLRRVSGACIFRLTFGLRKFAPRLTFTFFSFVPVLRPFSKKLFYDEPPLLEVRGEVFIKFYLKFMKVPLAQFCGARNHTNPHTVIPYWYVPLWAQ